MEPGEGAGEECLEQYKIDYAKKRRVDNKERVHQCRARKALSYECEDSSTAAVMETPHCTYLVDSNWSLHCISACLAKEFAMTISTRLRNYNPIVQHLTIEKFLG